MRSELAKWEGYRRQFQGVFVRFGTKSGYKRPLTTILLKDIIDVASQQLVADHIWFTLGKGFERLELQENDVVKLWARVTKYVKGYKGRREVEDKPLEQDYRLSFPTKLTRLPRGSIARELRAFNETVKSASEALKE